MNKDEILAKSRAENKNKDVYEQEVLKQASRSAVVVQMALATLFFVTQIFLGIVGDCFQREYDDQLGEIY